MAVSDSARSRAANVSAVIKRAGLTPRASGSTRHTGVVVRATLDWPTVCISDPHDRPSDNPAQERMVRERTAYVVEVLRAAGYLVDWTVKDLGGVHGHFGHIVVVDRRPKITKTEAAKMIAERALEFCRQARKDGYTNTIGTLQLQESAQVLDVQADSWTIERATRIVLADLSAAGEVSLIGEGLLGAEGKKLATPEADKKKCHGCGRKLKPNTWGKIPRHNDPETGRVCLVSNHSFRLSEQ